MGRVKTLLPEMPDAREELVRVEPDPDTRCDGEMLDVAIVAYASVVDVPVLDHEAGLRAVVEAVLELVRRRGEARTLETMREFEAYYAREASF